MKIDEMLRWIVPTPEQCRATAAMLRAEHPRLTDEQLAWKMVKSARTWATVAGAVSGVLTNPFVAAPASLAEAGYVLREEGRMAGAIAALLDPESLNDPELFRADIIGVLFPGAVSQALLQFGMRGGQFSAKAFIRSFMSRGVLAELLRLAARSLGLRITRRAIVSKTVPIVGGGIGAVWNWVEVAAVGRRAIRYHLERPPAGPVGAAAPPPASAVTVDEDPVL